MYVFPLFTVAWSLVFVSCGRTGCVLCVLMRVVLFAVWVGTGVSLLDVLLVSLVSFLSSFFSFVSGLPAASLLLAASSEVLPS